jgi:SanA protein
MKVTILSLKKKIKMFIIWVSIGIIIIVLILSSPRIITQIYSHGKIYDTNNTPAFTIAIVFGAGLRHDGTPTPILKDRVATAANLYFQGKVQKILMSGDNRFADYNEPGSMLAYAVELGVPEADIVLDYAGRRTYDTCYRAKKIFGVDNAILVTQRFHLPRAIFTCNMLLFFFVICIINVPILFCIGAYIVFTLYVYM